MAGRWLQAARGGRPCLGPTPAPGQGCGDGPRELQGPLSLCGLATALRLGFLVLGGCPSLEQAVRTGGYTHAPRFAHCLDSLVGNFCVTNIVFRSC